MSPLLERVEAAIQAMRDWAFHTEQEFCCSAEESRKLYAEVADHEAAIRELMSMCADAGE